MPDDQKRAPLSSRVQDGQLIISIGIETLALEVEERGDLWPDIQVTATDPEMLAKRVASMVIEPDGFSEDNRLMDALMGAVSDLEERGQLSDCIVDAAPEDDEDENPCIDHH